jgi:hypothetical protein
MTISFNEISLGMISVVVMSCDLDYTDCIIQAAEVRISVGRARGARVGADCKRSRSGCYTDRNRLSLQFQTDCIITVGRLAALKPE